MALILGGSEVAVEIEPRFSHRRGARSELADLRFFFVPRRCLMRVKSGGGEDTVGESGSQIQGGARTLRIHPGNHDPVDFGGARQELSGISIVELEMAVRVDPSHSTGERSPAPMEPKG